MLLTVLDAILMLLRIWKCRKAGQSIIHLCPDVKCLMLVLSWCVKCCLLQHSLYMWAAPSPPAPGPVLLLVADGHVRPILFLDWPSPEQVGTVSQTVGWLAMRWNPLKIPVLPTTGYSRTTHHSNNLQTFQPFFTHGLPARRDISRQRHRLSLLHNNIAI